MFDSFNVTADVRSRAPILQKQFPNILSTEPDKALQQLTEMAEQADPTGQQGKYLTWILRNVQEFSYPKPQNYPAVKELLGTFDEIKKVKEFPADKRDINKIPTVGDLANIIDFYGNLSSRGKKERDAVEQGQKLIVDEDDWKVIEITTPEAAADLCRGTNWCVKDIAYSKDYLRQGPLYLIIDMGDKIALAHPASDTIKDKRDNDLDTEEREKILNSPVGQLTFISDLTGLERSAYRRWRNGDLELDIDNVIDVLEEAAADDADNDYGDVSSDVSQLEQQALRLIKNDQGYGHGALCRLVSYWRHYEKGPNAELEDLILQTNEADAAWEYARWVLKRRWPEAEFIISMQASVAEIYAEHFHINEQMVPMLTTPQWVPNPEPTEWPMGVEQFDLPLENKVNQTVTNNRYKYAVEDLDSKKRQGLIDEDQYYDLVEELKQNMLTSWFPETPETVLASLKVIAACDAILSKHVKQAAVNWDTIQGIAEQVRGSIVKGEFSDDTCDRLSSILVNRLNSLGIAAEMRCGLFRCDNAEEVDGHSHCWIEVDNKILDITADQFNDHNAEQIEPILITALDDARYERYDSPEQINEEKYHIQDINYMTEEQKLNHLGLTEGALKMAGTEQNPLPPYGTEASQLAQTMLSKLNHRDLATLMYAYNKYADEYAGLMTLFIDYTKDFVLKLNLDVPSNVDDRWYEGVGIQIIRNIESKGKQVRRPLDEKAVPAVPDAVEPASTKAIPDDFDPMNIEVLHPADRQRKLDQILDAYSTEENPERKQQLEQQMRSLRASLNKSGLNSSANNTCPKCSGTRMISGDYGFNCPDCGFTDVEDGYKISAPDSKTCPKCYGTNVLSGSYGLNCPDCGFTNIDDSYKISAGILDPENNNGASVDMWPSADITMPAWIASQLRTKYKDKDKWQPESMLLFAANIIKSIVVPAMAQRVGVTEEEIQRELSKFAWEVDVVGPNINAAYIESSKRIIIDVNSLSGRVIEGQGTQLAETILHEIEHAMQHRTDNDVAQLEVPFSTLKHPPGEQLDATFETWRLTPGEQGATIAAMQQLLSQGISDEVILSKFDQGFRPWAETLLEIAKDADPQTIVSKLDGGFIDRVAELPILPADGHFSPEALDKIEESNNNLWADTVEGMALKAMPFLQEQDRALWDERQAAEAVARAYGTGDVRVVYSTPIMKAVLDQVIKWMVNMDRHAGYEDWKPTFLFDPSLNPVPFPKPGQRSGLWGWVYANDQAAKEHGTDDLDELAFLVDNTRELSEAAHREIKDPRMQEEGISGLIPVKNCPEAMAFLKRHFDEINREYVYPTWGVQKPEPGHEDDEFYLQNNPWKGVEKQVVQILRGIYGEGDTGSTELSKFLGRLSPDDQEDFIEEAGKDGFQQMMEGLTEVVEKATGKTKTPSSKSRMRPSDVLSVNPDEIQQAKDDLLDQYNAQSIDDDTFRSKMDELSRAGSIGDCLTCKGPLIRNEDKICRGCNDPELDLAIEDDMSGTGK